MDFQTALREVKGIGEKTEQRLQNMGVYTVGDILLRFPRAYITYPKPQDVIVSNSQEKQAIIGILKTPIKNRKTAKMEISLGSIFVQEELVECIWFRSPYISKQVKCGVPYVFYGMIKKEHGSFKMEMPEVFSLEKYDMLLHSFQPVYSLTKGVTNTAYRKILKKILEECQAKNDTLPDFVCQREGFLSYIESIANVHFPRDFQSLSLGRKRLVYQEFFYYVLYAKVQTIQAGMRKNTWNYPQEFQVDHVIKKLPFALTNGQQETLQQIRQDLRGSWITQRLIQGDVGCGKTLVAFLAMLDAVSNGYQAALMAPTEVLAKQHYETFVSFCQMYQLPYQVVCLTGSVTGRERREIYETIARESSLFIIGTHALIQEQVKYQNLSLVITDEQHRFGVKQREQLAEKGMYPHILVMSATPIPRTLAMILHSNMQISEIRELPAQRLPIKTCVIGEDSRNTAYRFLLQEVKKGHQGYIICPLVEASEKTDAENVLEYTEKVREILGPDISVGMLHGKMPAREKNSIMEAFAEGKFSILISTTVVEVGVNVVNATVMMIENANRFGLAQLHQLRGRVGRGKEQSYCILMNQSKKEAGKKRLEVLNDSNDGFYIAQEDLKLRGPGDFFGIRQSGELNFKLADIIGDAHVLKQAAQDVENVLQQDPTLENHAELKTYMLQFEKENRLIL